MKPKKIVNMKPNTGLEERLHKIINTHLDNVNRFQDDLDKLRGKLRFCHEHKFEEEERITLLKINQMDMLLYEYKSMFKEVSEAINDWES